MSADNHPDLFPVPEEKKRQLAVQIELNAAREALETREYSRLSDIMAGHTRTEALQ